MGGTLARSTQAVTCVTACVTTVIVAAAGCGDGTGGLPNAALMMRDAAISAGSVHAAHIALHAHGAVPGFPVRQLDADVSDHDGGTATGTATVLGTSIAFVEKRGALFTEQPDGALLPAAGGVPNPTALIGPAGGIAHLLATLRDPETVARENLGGVDAFRIEAGVPAAALQAIVPTDHADAKLIVWVRVHGIHIPLRTTIIFPNVPGASLDLHIAGPTTTPRQG